MSQMKGVLAESKAAPWKVVNTIQVPEPGPNQVLVKSICAAINPVDAFVWGTGFLLDAWPLVIGCDASGIVVKRGANVSNLKEGDRVFGCTRLGIPGYSPGQEYHLMDAALALPTPKHITFEQAATLGVGTETAALGIFNGLNVEVPNPKLLPAPKDEWAVLLGASSSVGKSALQILKACGFKVIASCSASSQVTVRSFGADAFVDYKQPLDQQIKTVLEVTDKNFSRVFDAAGKGADLATALLKESRHDRKFFTTTNESSVKKDSNTGIEIYPIAMGPIGRPSATQLNKDLERFIPAIVGLVEVGKIKPSEYVVIGSVGVESAIEAFAYQQRGDGGSKKVIFKLQET